MSLTDVLRNWAGGTNRKRGPDRSVVGIFGMPRGGTNFIAAALHYHPRVFAVSEHETDFRRPLSKFWKTCSIYREDGRQAKQIEQVNRVVFNKVQRRPDLWSPSCEFPDGARFLFYIRNPIRVHLSRESYRAKHEPARANWADTPENFETILRETREILETYAAMKERYPCLLLSHEYFCCAHARALPQLQEFMGIDPLPPGDAREFFRSCGQCRRELTTIEQEGQTWLACPKHLSPIDGCGNFNPLRPVDAAEVRGTSWKVIPDVQRLMREVRTQLGPGIADYYWHGRYNENLNFDSATLRNVA